MARQQTTKNPPAHLISPSQTDDDAWTDVQLSSRYIYDDGYLDAQVSRIPEEFVRSVTQDPPNRSGPHYVQMLDPAVRPDALDLVSDLLAPTRKGKSALFK